MSAISDITDTETGIVQSTLDERWGKDKVKPQVVDVEARLSKGDRELTECPVLYWEQFGTSIPEYDNMGDCVLSLLRLQADHEITRAEEQESENIDARLK